MKKFTDEQIINNVKCCAKQISNCSQCSYRFNEDEEFDCEEALGRDTLDLSNRQAAEIERLALELDISKALHKEAVAERNFYCHQMIRFESMFKTAKSEAIKEFAERLKEHSFVDNLSLDGKETVC